MSQPLLAWVSFLYGLFVLGSVFSASWHNEARAKIRAGSTGTALKLGCWLQSAWMYGLPSWFFWGPGWALLVFVAMGLRLAVAVANAETAERGGTLAGGGPAQDPPATPTDHGQSAPALERPRAPLPAGSSETKAAIGIVVLGLIVTASVYQGTAERTRGAPSQARTTYQPPTGPIVANPSATEAPPPQPTELYPGDLGDLPLSWESYSGGRRIGVHLYNGLKTGLAEISVLLSGPEGQATSYLLKPTRGCVVPGTFGQFVGAVVSVAPQHTLRILDATYCEAVADTLPPGSRVLSLNELGDLPFSWRFLEWVTSTDERATEIRVQNRTAWPILALDVDIAVENKVWIPYRFTAASQGYREAACGSTAYVSAGEVGDLRGGVFVPRRVNGSGSTLRIRSALVCKTGSSEDVRVSVPPPPPPTEEAHPTATAAAGRPETRCRGDALPACRAACTAGDSSVCNDAGEGVEAQAATAASPNVLLEDAFTLYSRACEASVARGCLNAGRIFEGGAAVARDEARAAELYMKACGLGDTRACASFNRLYVTGRSHK